MSIIFAVRGDSLNARYSTAGKVGKPFTNSGSLPAVEANAGAIGGQVINCVAGGTVRKGVTYPGRNLGTLSAFSVLLRFAPNYSGNPANNRSLWSFGPVSSAVYFGGGYIKHLTNGKFDLFFGGANNGGQTIGFSTTPTWSPTAGTFYDLGLSWDGTTAANGIKIYIDGVLFAQGTANAAIVANYFLPTSIDLAMDGSGVNGDLYVNEFVVWNEVFDFTTLAGRSAFVTVDSFDGVLSTDPGEENVLDGEGYTINGVAKLGTLSASTNPGAENVKTGTPYNINGVDFVGTYDCHAAASEYETWAPIESQKTIFETLANDSTLMTLLGAVTEVQRITLASAPASGTFKLVYSGTATAAITGLGVSAATIQSALRLIEGLEVVTVSLVSANVYDVTMVRVAGNVTALSVSENSTAVSITFAEQTKGIQKVFDFVPDNTPYPYVTMQILPFVDRGSHTYEGWQCELQITTWYRATGRGNLQVQTIQKRIDELLHNTSICVEGWNTVGLRRTFVDILTGDDNVTKQGIQRFNLMIGES